MTEDCLVHMEGVGKRDRERGGCSGLCKRLVSLDPSIKLN